MARPQALVGLGVLLWLLGGPIAPGRAQACVCMPQPPPTPSAARADAVFEGQVLERSAQPTPREGDAFPSHAGWQVKVLRTWKGDVQPGQQVEVVSGHHSCFRSLHVPATYLFYLSRNDAGKFDIGQCGRTITSARAGADIAVLGEADGNWYPTRYLELEPNAFVADAPPAPPPSARGCSFGGPAMPGPWLLLLPVLARWRRRA